MEEIKVGEYVRLDDGTIGKYQINKNWINVVETNDKDIGFDIEKDIIKHSFNIIDLIEVGDYVNGEKVVGRGNNCILILTDEGQTFLRNIFEDNDIKSIVTKEMMKSIEYIVGESNEDS